MRLSSTFGTAVGRARATGMRAFGAMAGFVSFAARATARLAMRLFAPNLRTFRARTGFTKVVPRTTPLRTAGLWAFWAVTLAESWARSLRTAVWWLRATSLRTAGLWAFWAVTLAESWARSLRTAVWWLRATSLRTASLRALGVGAAVAGLAATMVATVAVIVQHILNALERGFAAFFAGAAFALAFAARALTGPAFSFTAWTLPRTSLRASSHFLQFLGLFFSEDGSHFLLVFFAESAESLTKPLAIFAFPGFSHQFAKGGTLIFLQFFHLQSLFFVEPESLGHGGTAIGAFAAFAAGFGATLSGATSFFVCLNSGGQQAGR